MRRVLVLAYYFPPMGLSGVQRVAKFVKYLPEHGWQPTVLTVEPGGYFAFDPTLLAEVEAAGVEIVRTASLDPTRLFGQRSTVALPGESARRWWAALSSVFFVPDNKLGWLPFAVATGLRLLRSGRFDAILSSAPPYTSHLAGALLHRLTGLPLLTDFRDDWVGNPRHTYPTPAHRSLHEALERFVLRNSTTVTTINHHIRDALVQRNAGVLADQQAHVITQGFDPADFPDHRLPSSARRPQAGELSIGEGSETMRDPSWVGTTPKGLRSLRLRWLHSGIFYDVQTPDYFLMAYRRFLDERPAAWDDTEAVFVGLVPEASQQLAVELGLSGLMRYEGYLPHERVPAKLREADVLWMTIGERPGAEGISSGKLFEYFGARKPVLGLVPEGEAARSIRAYGAGWVAPPADRRAITEILCEVYDRWKAGTLPAPDEARVERYDRRCLAGGLARLLDEMTP